MSNVFPALNEHIRRLARREARAEGSATRRLAAQYRHEIAALRRMVKTLGERVAMLERGGFSAVGDPAELPENVRFRADGLRSHRARVGLSALDYGRLVGVSALTVYNWESGKAKPRRRQLASLLAVRSLKKREIVRRLAGSNGRPH